VEAPAAPPSALHRFRAATARRPACLDLSADGLAGRRPSPEGGRTIRVTDVTSQEDAIGWALRIPCVTDGEAVEIRQVYDATETPEGMLSAETGAVREVCRAITRRRPRCPGPGRATSAGATSGRRHRRPPPALATEPHRPVRLRPGSQAIAPVENVDPFGFPPS
jgi:hypothetical protein